MFQKISLLLLCTTNYILAVDNVLIITHAFNQPRFIEWQKKTIEKFVKDPYRFIVFNDARDENMAQQIEYACTINEVETIRIPQNIHINAIKPNDRHTDNVQFSLETIGYDFDGIVCILDSDLFVTRPLSFNEELEGYSFVSLMQGAGSDPLLGPITFMAPALCIMRMNKLPDKYTLNFRCGKIGHSTIVDSGGHTFFYIKAHPELNIKSIDWKPPYEMLCPDRFNPSWDRLINISDSEKIVILKERGFTNFDIKFLLQKPNQINYALRNIFFHFAAGSNYDNWSRSEYERKMTMVSEYINELVNNS